MKKLILFAAIAVSMPAGLATAGEAAPPPAPELARTVAAFVGKSVYDSTITMPGGQPHEDQVHLRLQEDRPGQGGDLPVLRNRPGVGSDGGLVPDRIRHPRQGGALHGHDLRRGGARPHVPLERQRPDLRSPHGRHGGAGHHRRSLVLVCRRGPVLQVDHHPGRRREGLLSRARRRSRWNPCAAQASRRPCGVVLNHAMLALASAWAAARGCSKPWPGCRLRPAKGSPARPAWTNGTSGSGWRRW